MSSRAVSSCLAPRHVPTGRPAPFARGCRVDGADLREVEAGAARGPRALVRPAGARDPAGAPAGAAAEAAGGPGERARAALHRARRPELRHRHGLLSARLLHDEAQPARERAGRRAAGLPRPPPAPGGRGRPGRAGADVGAAADPRRGRGAPRGDAPAGGRLAGRADGPDADARLVRRARRARARP